jgi:hypothetical protein
MSSNRNQSGSVAKNTAKHLSADIKHQQTAARKQANAPINKDRENQHVTTTTQPVSATTQQASRAQKANAKQNQVQNQNQARRQ